MKAIPIDSFWLVFLRALDRKIGAPSVKAQMAVSQFVKNANNKRLASESLPKAIGTICDLYQCPALGIKAGLAVSSVIQNPFMLAVRLAPDAKDLGWAINCIFATIRVPDLQMRSAVKEDMLSINFNYSTDSRISKPKGFEACIEMPLVSLVMCLVARTHDKVRQLTVTAPVSRVDMLREHLVDKSIKVMPGDIGRYHISLWVGVNREASHFNEWHRLAEELRLFAAPFGGQFEIIESVAHYLHYHPTPAATRQSEIAHEIGMSVSSLKRVFSDQGMVFKDLIHKVIVARAARELSSTDTSVEEIAAGLGFKDRSSMTKSFKAMLGQTPAEYRRSHRYLHKTLVPDLLGFLEGASLSNEAVTQLLKLRDRDGATFDDVAKVLAIDPLAAARVISVASKAYYGVRIRSLHDAIARCHGVNGAIDLALFVSSASVFDESQLSVPSSTLFKIGRGANSIFKFMEETRGWQSVLEPEARELASFFFPLGYYITLNSHFISKQITEIWRKDPFEFGEVLYQEYGVTTAQITHMVISSWGIFHPAVTSINKLSVLVRPDEGGAMVPSANALLLSESAINGRDVLVAAIRRLQHQGVNISEDDAPEILRIMRQL